MSALHGSDIFHPFRRPDPRIADHSLRRSPLFLQAHYEMAECNAHIDLLQIPGRLAGITLILFLIKRILAILFAYDPPGLLIDRRRRPAQL